MEDRNIEYSHVETTMSFHPMMEAPRDKEDFSPLEPEAPTMTSTLDKKETGFRLAKELDDYEMEEQEAELVILGQSAMLNPNLKTDSGKKSNLKSSFTTSKIESFDIIQPLLLDHEKSDGTNDKTGVDVHGNMNSRGNSITVKESDAKR